MPTPCYVTQNLAMMIMMMMMMMSIMMMNCFCGMIDWQKAFMHYFGLGPLSEILTITNLQEAQEGFQ